MARERKHNGFYTYGRFCLQITLHNFQWSRFVLDLIPQMCFGHNYQATAAIGFEWLFGTVNFAILNPEYVESRAAQKVRRIQLATEKGLTLKQYEARYGG